MQSVRRTWCIIAALKLVVGSMQEGMWRSLGAQSNPCLKVSKETRTPDLLDSKNNVDLKKGFFLTVAR